MLNYKSKNSACQPKLSMLHSVSKNSFCQLPSDRPQNTCLPRKRSKFQWFWFNNSSYIQQTLANGEKPDCTLQVFMGTDNLGRKVWLSTPTLEPHNVKDSQTPWPKSVFFSIDANKNVTLPCVSRFLNLMLNIDDNMLQSKGFGDKEKVKNDLKNGVFQIMALLGVQNENITEEMKWKLLNEVDKVFDGLYWYESFCVQARKYLIQLNLIIVK